MIYGLCLKARNFLIACFDLTAFLYYPFNVVRSIMAGRRYPPDTSFRSKRVFHYNHSLLPNSYLSQQDEGLSEGLDSAMQKTGFSIGYPAWNLLYYSLFCSLSDKNREAVVVETGTNQGYSTIVLAQVLNDLRAHGFVHTVDIDGGISELAKENVGKAGLSDYVKFYTGDAVAFLKKLVKEKKYIDFILIDDLHTFEQVKKVFAVVYPRIVACKGKAYFDNACKEDVWKAVRFIKRAYGGNIIEFDNCSWWPPGNTIWQPD